MIVENKVKDFWKEHPWLTGMVILGVIVIILFATGAIKLSSSKVVTSSEPDVPLTPSHKASHHQDIPVAGSSLGEQETSSLNAWQMSGLDAASKPSLPSRSGLSAPYTVKGTKQPNENVSASSLVVSPFK
jgi:hypothetical protein